MINATTAEPKIACRNVWKVFGPKAGRGQADIDLGLSKHEILARTGHVVAVRDVSFDVRQGEIFVIMGLSGSGKSTLIRCISRLIEPTHGQIFIEGNDIMTLDDEQLRELRRHKITMIFQHFGLFPHRRVIDNVGYGLEVQGMRKAERLERAREVVELVGLKGWENHFPHELSGGMRQRVGLARALAVDPEYLLCDEPFSALDPLIRREMQDELVNLQKMVNKTLIFITHDFHEALKIGDHICIMKDGEFVQIGTPEQIVSQPADDYVREFTRDVPRAKVLTARAIMTPVAEGEERLLPFSDRQTLADGVIVSPDTKLEALIPFVVSSEQPVPVVDHDNRLVGFVDRQAVMLALAEQ